MKVRVRRGDHSRLPSYLFKRMKQHAKDVGVRVVGVRIGIRVVGRTSESSFESSTMSFPSE